MIFTDLRQYVATLEKLGQLKVIEGASCELEIGAITEMATCSRIRRRCCSIRFKATKKAFAC